MPTPKHEPALPLDYARPGLKRVRRTHPVTWAVGAIVLVVLTLAMIGDHGGHARPAAERIIKCAYNLKQIGQAMLLYANDCQGRYPDTIAGLLEEELTPAVFVCPSTNDTPAASAPTTQATAANILSPGHLSYIYLGKGLTNKVSADTVLAYEPLANHANTGMNVLFGDGHVEFVQKKDALYLLSELSAGHNPPRPNPATQPMTSPPPPPS